MATGPSESDIQIVKSTIPVLKTHGVAIVTRFYHVLFERYPSVMPQFNMDRHEGGVVKKNGVPAQVAALARAVLAYASHIDNLEAILPVVESICHKHVSRGVIAPQYQAVGECLLFAFKDVLGEACTAEITDAWAAAYKLLADTFINIEKKVLEDVSKSAGYTGFKAMRITRNEVEEDGDITVWVLADDGKVPPHRPGQFVALRVQSEDGTRAMTTAHIDETSSTELRLSLPGNKGVTNLGIMNRPVGAMLDVGMPCGASKKYTKSGE